MRYIFFILGVTFLTPVFAQGQQVNVTIGSDNMTDPVLIDGLATDFMGPANQRIKQAGSDENIVWNEALNGAYFGFMRTVDSVTSRLVDMALVKTVWEYEILPLQNVTYHTPFASDDLGNVVRSVNQLHDDYPALKAAWREVDVEFLAATGTPEYQLITNFPVTSPVDLSGRVILAPDLIGDWISGIGAIPKNGIPLTYLRQISEGEADGAVMPVSEMIDQKIIKVAPYVTMIGFGAQANGALVANAEAWGELSTETQRVMKALAVEFSEKSAARIMENEAAAVVELFGSGVEIRELSREERQVWAEKLAVEDVVWGDSVEPYDGDGLVSAYLNKLREFGPAPLIEWDLR